MSTYLRLTLDISLKFIFDNLLSSKYEYLAVVTAMR